MGPNATPGRRPIRAIVVDDSALIRTMLSQILSADPEIEVVATAGDPLIARTKIKELNPDVVTLDIEMPNLDGLSFLEKLMRLRPMPVVVVSALTEEGSTAALRALELGAVDVLAKPRLGTGQGWAAAGAGLVATIKAAADARIVPRTKDTARPAGESQCQRRGRGAAGVVAIGASTGGVYAVAEILQSLPADMPPVLIIQHMSGTMIERYAQRLDRGTGLRVLMATDGSRAESGHAYFAPAGRHLTLARTAGQFVTRLEEGPPVSGHRPSVDVLFASVAEAAGRMATAVLLTGMGRDGAKGLLQVRTAGGSTACQDEPTSLIYGMPKAAVEIGAAQAELPLQAIPHFIVERVGGQALESTV